MIREEQAISLKDGTTQDMVESREWVRIWDLSKESGLPRSWLYEQSRFNRLPGMARAGKYILIHRQTFFEALRRGELGPRRYSKSSGGETT